MRNKEDFILTCVFCAFVFALFAVPPTIMWYKAGIQQRVYKRQNIEITQWEVFCGAEPAEKVIQVKE